MRLLRGFGLAFLVACTTDTFVGTDGGDDVGLGDAPSDGGKIEGGQPDAGPPDPNLLANKVVLWLMASDAQTNAVDAGNLVTAWPDHKNKVTTFTNIGGTSTSCIPGLHKSNSAALNGKPTIAFCQANLTVNDTSPLQLGNNPFVIEAVYQPTPATAGSNFVLFAKVPTGNNVPLNGLSLLAPSSSGNLVGSLSSSAIASSSNAIGTSFQYGGIVRNAAGFGVRVNGNPGPVIASNADVSAQGASVGIGGYLFDAGIMHNIFGGELAELIVANDASDGTIQVIEGYFKLKYSL